MLEVIFFRGYLALMSTFLPLKCSANELDNIMHLAFVSQWINKETANP